MEKKKNKMPNYNEQGWRRKREREREKKKKELQNTRETSIACKI